MADFIYLPDTHESQPEFVRVGDVCYELIETIPRDEHKEDHCWEDLSCKLEDATSCDECCWPSVLYEECCKVYYSYNAPSVSVTVSGNGPGGENETIGWCGKMWLPSDDGVTFDVCPDTYHKGRKLDINTDSLTWTFHYTREEDGIHMWKANGLSMTRRFKKVKRTDQWGPFLEYGRYTNELFVENSFSWISTHTADGVAGPRETDTDLGGMILGVSRPTWDDYNITDAFFGSHTIDGITYTWAKVAECWG